MNFIFPQRVFEEILWRFKRYVGAIFKHAFFLEEGTFERRSFWGRAFWKIWWGLPWLKTLYVLRVGIEVGIDDSFFVKFAEDKTDTNPSSEFHKQNKKKHWFWEMFYKHLDQIFVKKKLKYLRRRGEKQHRNMWDVQPDEAEKLGLLKGLPINIGSSGDFMHADRAGRRVYVGNLPLNMKEAWELRDFFNAVMVAAQVCCFSTRWYRWWWWKICQSR